MPDASAVTLPSSVPPLSTSTKRLASAVPVTVLSALTELTVPSAPPTAVMAMAGATVSTANVKAADVPVLPAASVWRALMDLLPPWPSVARFSDVKV